MNVPDWKSRAEASEARLVEVLNALIAAPGPGKAIALEWEFYAYPVVGSPYLISDQIGVFYGDPSGILAGVNLTPVLTSSDSSFQAGIGAAGLGQVTFAQIENLAIVFAATLSDPTNGGGSVIGSLTYEIIDLSA